MPFKRHTRHGCVFLVEVCRTIDNTLVLVLKMLVPGSMYRGPCIDVHERANKGEHGA